MAAAIAGLTFWLGRRDLTHPAVAFGVTWFLSIALAQTELTPFVHDWSPSFAVMVIAGGLAFISAAVVAGGTKRARGTVGPRRSDYNPNRVLAAAIVLLLSGLLGRWLESRILGGVPLLGNTDALRSEAYGTNGNVAIPAYVTFLSNGFYLGGWCLLAYLWLRWSDLSRWAIAAISAGLLIASIGALAGGSRNVLLYGIAVPLISAYAFSTTLSRRTLAFLSVAGVALLGVFAGVFVVRAGDNQSTQGFLQSELDRQPLAVRPLVPIFIAATYPLETERRLVNAIPTQFSPTNGGATLASLPDAAFPGGKPPFSNMMGQLTNTGFNTPNWTVASYQGRIIADFGAASVLPFSILLGLFFGACYRACRNRRGLLPLTTLGIVAYYAAFMPYDNLLSFSLGVFYDVAVVACVALFARGLMERGRLQEPDSGGAQRTEP